jgi:hypothetical protein
MTGDDRFRPRRRIIAALSGLTRGSRVAFFIFGFGLYGHAGFVRGATGGYSAALMLCLTLQLVSAAIVLRRSQRVVPA